MYEANLGGVFRLYRASLARCWVPALVLALAGATLGIRLQQMLPVADDPLQWLLDVRSLMYSGEYWRLLFAIGVISMLCFGALVAVMHAIAVPGAPAAAAAGFGPALHALPSALVAGAIFFVVTSLASVAFLIPGAYLWGMWQLWLVTTTVDRLGPVAALRRSWQLVSGAWWRITTLTTVVVVIVSVALTVGPLAVAAVMIGRTGVVTERMTAYMNVTEAVINLLLAPLITAAFVVAYLDRTRAHAAHA